MLINFYPSSLKIRGVFYVMRLHLPRPLQMLVFGAYKLFAHSMGYLLYSLHESDHFGDCVSQELWITCCLSTALEAACHPSIFLKEIFCESIFLFYGL